MPKITLRSAALAGLLFIPNLVLSEDAMNQFSLSDPNRWTYFSDQVMGGVSEGQAAFQTEGQQPVLRLTGDVSTANRGGFVQVRTDLDSALPASAVGLELKVRGNDQTYFVHLRTGGTVLPWQYYQAPFEATQTWQTVRIPFTAFRPSGGILRKTPKPDAIKSVAIVAYGRDHSADVSVRSVGIY